MTNATNRSQGRRQTAALAILLVLQSIAAVFFVGDAFADLQADPQTAHSIVESLVAVVLVLGIIVGGWQLRITLDRMRGQERALDAARGEFARVIDTQFDIWGLTLAEHDVGRLALKGLDVAEIAAIRGAAPGTVRAQLARIYAKAGVSGRAQLAAWFVEDLFTEKLLPESSAETSPKAAPAG